MASNLVEPALGDAGPGSRFDMLLLIRHADAGHKGSHTGPDVLRPLTPAGRRQAEGLVVRLEDYPVERILCSPTMRCHETVQPLAGDRFLEIEHVAALGVEGTPAQLLAELEQRDLRNAVLCTHGELIGKLLAELVADGLVVEEPLEWPKGSTWLLERAGQRPIRGRLLAPLLLGQGGNHPVKVMPDAAGPGSIRHDRSDPSKEA